MHPEIARIIAGHRCAEVAASRHRGRRRPAGPPRAEPVARRPDGAVPFELVVLGRPVPEPAGVDD
jgi:hypothetical protein